MANFVPALVRNKHQKNGRFFCLLSCHTRCNHDSPYKTNFQHEFLASNYKRVPWEDESPEEVWMQGSLLLYALGKVKPDSRAGKLLEEHVENSVICSIYFSNKVEEKGISLTETFKLVKDVVSGVPALDPDLGSAPAGRVTRREVVHHAAAWAYLRDQVVHMKQPLTEATVLEAHRLLMTDMQREDGLLVQAGCYRSGPANAGFHRFPPASYVRSGLVYLLEEYSTRLNDPSEDPFALAAWLSYEFVTIHPFDDGNGRMCRLLLNIVLLSRGVPFASALGFSSGHRQSKKHYMQCIKDARKCMKAHKLAFVILCGFRSTAASFFEALRFYAPDEYRSTLIYGRGAALHTILA